MMRPIDDDRVGLSTLFVGLCKPRSFIQCCSDALLMSPQSACSLCVSVQCGQLAYARLLVVTEHVVRSNPFALPDLLQFVLHQNHPCSSGAVCPTRRAVLPGYDQEHFAGPSVLAASCSSFHVDFATCWTLGALAVVGILSGLVSVLHDHLSSCDRYELAEGLPSRLTG